MKRFRQDMLTGPLFPSIVSYTIPIILTGLLQLLFHAADLVVVGTKGEIYLSAVGATNAITNLIVNMFIGLSVGAGVTMAHAMGCRDPETIHRTVHTAIPTAVIGGVVLTVVGILLAEPMLRLMDTPESVLPYSTLYMQIFFGGMVFNMVYNFGAALLRAAGDTKGPLLYLTIAGVCNVLLNLFFVLVLGMTVDGVALATITSQAISAVLVVLALMRRKDAARLQIKKLRIYGEQIKKIVRLGLPAGIQGSLFSISNVLIQSSVNSFGEIFMAGNTAAGSIEGFVYVTMNAFHQTALNFTGQNLGAGQYQRVRKVLWICLGCVTAVGMAVGGGIYLLREPLLRIYIVDSPNAAQAIAAGAERMMYVCLPYFLLGMMDVTTGVLRGLGSSMTPMIISVLGVCGLRIGWIYTLFAANPTPQVLFVSYPVSWALTFACQLTAFIWIFRKRVASHNRLNAV
ncbi:MAG: MATE family efflux transporter [Oscillospiraceae bacterium]|nr:MATE family efflux transporter [Oscillospiraceae bacterium]